MVAADSGGITMVAVWGELAMRMHRAVESKMQGLAEELYVKVELVKFCVKGHPEGPRRLESGHGSNFKLAKDGQELRIVPAFKSIITDMRMVASQVRMVRLDFRLIWVRFLYDFVAYMEVELGERCSKRKV